MRNELYDYSPIPEREPLIWPNGARIAFYVGLNVEYFNIDAAATSITPATAGLVPDPLNYGWRDYGPRVGIWRMIETLDKHGVPASVLLNSDCCENYPAIIEAGNQRNWAWLAHGKDNNTFEPTIEPDAERAYLSSVVETIEAATGTRPRGWLGPALSESFETPRLLAELGLEYVLDWCSDDQPFDLAVPGMISVPYAIELNDVSLCVTKSYTGPDFQQAIIDQFDQLYADSEHSGRVMSLPLHPFVSGQPLRNKYLDRALKYIVGHEGVWLTTSDEIATQYSRQTSG
jgi:allantoinase